MSTLISMLHVWALALASQAPPKWALRLDLAVGDIDGPQSFAAIVGLKIGPRGEMIPLEFNSTEVRVFRADGSFGWSIGRAGSGPGEFANPTSMGWHGDTLWIVDTGNNRLSMFRLPAEHIGDVSFSDLRSVSRSYSVPRVSALLRDGSLLAVAGVPTTLRSQGVRGHRLILKLSTGGVILDTLLTLPASDNQARVTLRGGQLVPLLNPFRFGALQRVATDGRSVITVDRQPSRGARGQFMISVLSTGGETVAARRVDYAAARMTRRDAERIVEKLAESIATTFRRTRAAVIDDLLNQLEVPPAHPPVSDLIAGRDQTIWVRREAITGKSTVPWEVHDSKINPIGRVDVPVDLNVLAASADFVWGTTISDLGVPRLLRYRVIRR